MEFIETRVFTRRLFQLLGDRADEILREIQADLEKNPHRGALVPGLAGIRKARHSDPSRGKGKRGGLRSLYLYLEFHEHVHLLYLFGKNEQEDLTFEERAQLRELAVELKRQENQPWPRRSR